MRAAVFFLCGAAITLLLGSYVAGSFAWIVGDPMQRMAAVILGIMGGCVGAIIWTEVW